MASDTTPMRLILSRKGFDSSRVGGGCPSPIFPDGSMIALPIPDKHSPIRYADLAWRGRNLGEIVQTLSKGCLHSGYRAHLDPDLRRDLLARHPDWRAALGQVGIAQSHLRNQHVGPGDLFLFWGLFRPVDEALRPAGPAAHYVWGWLQIGQVVSVDAEARVGGPEWAWAAMHPHLSRPLDPSNTLYVAADRLTIPGLTSRGIPGWSTFDIAAPELRLTAYDATGVSDWALPACFLPGARPALTFHGDPNRWSKADGMVRLRTVDRGQEFVLDLEQYPDVVDWVAGLASTAPAAPLS